MVANGRQVVVVPVAPRFWEPRSGFFGWKCLGQWHFLTFFPWSKQVHIRPSKTLEMLIFLTIDYVMHTLIFGRWWWWCFHRCCVPELSISGSVCTQTWSALISLGKNLLKEATGSKLQWNCTKVLDLHTSCFSIPTTGPNHYYVRFSRIPRQRVAIALSSFTPSLCLRFMVQVDGSSHAPSAIDGTNYNRL